jgi:energy-coupling factor transport system permease protein
MIIHYIKGQSQLHRLHALSKLSAVIVYSVSIFLVNNLVFQALGLAAIMVVDYTIGSTKLRSFLFSRFVLGLAGTILIMQVLFAASGKTLLVVPLPWFRIALTDLGVLKGILMMLRFLNVILAGGVFVATTDPVALVYSLMKAGVPYRYGFMVLMMLRFIPLFEAEITTVSNAQKVRGLELDKGSIRKLLLSIRYTVVPLVVSALSKADMLAMSMEGRAFGYRRTRTFLTADRYSAVDRALITASIAALMLLLACSVMGWLPLRHMT